MEISKYYKAGSLSSIHLLILTPAPFYQHTFGELLGCVHIYLWTLSKIIDF